MPKIRMMSGISAISGRLGNMYFRTDKSTGCITLCRMPRKTAKPLTDSQRARQERFAAIAKIVTQMRQHGTNKNSKQLWKIAAEAYDAAHQL